MRRRRADRGLLLFEVCVALTLMALSVVWMLRSFAQTGWLAERARMTTLALHAAHEHALIASIRGVSADGAQGAVPALPDGAWTLTATPLADDATLAATAVRVAWTTQRRSAALTVWTWLPLTAE